MTRFATLSSGKEEMAMPDEEMFNEPPGMESGAPIEPKHTEPEETAQGPPGVDWAAILDAILGVNNE